MSNTFDLPLRRGKISAVWSGRSASGGSAAGAAELAQLHKRSRGEAVRRLLAAVSRPPGTGIGPPGGGDQWHGNRGPTGFRGVE